MSRKNRGDTEFILEVAVTIADGLLAVGQVAAKEGFKDVFVPQIQKKLHLLPAAAINLSLAIELYLKALLNASGRRPQTTHELRKLFKALPPDLKESLESK